MKYSIHSHFGNKSAKKRYIGMKSGGYRGYLVTNGVNFMIHINFIGNHQQPTWWLPLILVVTGQFNQLIKKGNHR